ncbi:MAG: hypothetical protein Q9168_004139 [Polycauliona sp. 1 TL-2023]
MSRFSYVIYLCMGLIVLSSAEASNATLSEYIVYPKPDLNLPSAHALQNLIKSLIVDPDRLYTSMNPINPGLPNFWLGNLESPTYERLSQESHVLQIHPNARLTNRPGDPKKSKRSTPPTITQKKPPRDLRVLSQPPVEGTTIDDYPDYVWPSFGEEETFIYDIGEGINTAHREFKNRKIEWLYPPVATFKGTDTPTEIPGNAHQTCVVSKAMGNWAGSSKTSTLVVLKIPDESEASFLELWETILVDITAKGRQHHSVINYSYNIYNHPDYREYTCWKKIARDMANLMKLGVLITTSAGNAGPHVVDSFPARLADSTTEFYNHIIVVGAVDFNGAKTDFTEELGHAKMLWAPGQDIFCPKGDGVKTGYVIEDGTSLSAPLVAGVIATWLPEINKRADPAKRGEWVLDHLKWDRPNGLPIVWNGMTPPRRPADQEAPSIAPSALWGPIQGLRALFWRSS